MNWIYLAQRLARWLLGGKNGISWCFPGKIMLMETPILGSEPLKGTRHPFVLHLVMNDPELSPITAPREVTGPDRFEVEFNFSFGRHI